MKRRFLAAALCLVGLASQAIRADVKPHGLFTDHMVLQRGVNVPIWGTAAPGEKITVTLGPETDLRSGSATADKNGTWRVEIPKSDAGGPFDLTIAGNNTIKLTDVLVGDVWVCSGQSNMEWGTANTSTAKEMLAEATMPKLRLLTVRKGVAGSPRKELDPPLPPEAPRTAWLNSTPGTAASFSAVGFYFGRQLVKDLDVPIGLIHTSWGGTPAEAWTSMPALQREPVMKKLLETWDANLADGRKRIEQYAESMKTWYEQSNQEYALARPISVSPPPINNQNDPRFSPHRPATLFNAMIAPLIDFPIKGAIWYQGESNVARAEEYRTLFPVMIKDWREQWKQPEMPFLFVQLANYLAATPKPVESGWAELREAQMMALKLPKTGTAVAIDIGEAADIHPKNKFDVGLRLALAAKAVVYGKNIVYSGPIYESMSVEGSSIRVKFKHVGGGLVVKGDAGLKGFAIGGADGNFAHGQATIDGDSVIVKSDEVAKPTAVRYGWANNPPCNLYNKEGLPASPFRTDGPR